VGLNGIGRSVESKSDFLEVPGQVHSSCQFGNSAIVFLAGDLSFGLLNTVKGVFVSVVNTVLLLESLVSVNISHLI
jgi:hypothetical protein